MYAAGYLAGLSSAQLEEATAYRREALVLVALGELGVNPAASRAIIEQARHDARLTVPGCSEFSARLIGAEMIITILRRRIAAAACETEAAA